MEWQDLPSWFPEFLEPARWLPLLQHHAELLRTSPESGRLTAVPPDQAVRRNYGESLELYRLARARALPGQLVDIGSGAGFPGMVIAAIDPGIDVHLVEPLARRAGFLQRAATALDLPNITVHCARAEDAGRGPLRETAGLVVARAVAELRELTEYAAPFAAPGGWLAFAKGSSVEAELSRAENAFTLLNCALAGREPMRPEVSDTPWVVLLRKTGPLAPLYPRRAGMPHKRPL